MREAMQRADWKQWEQAAQQEYDSIQTAGTWTLVPPPASRVAIGCKWVFRLKRNGLYKARLVAKGYAQKEGIDYTETFAPVAKFSTIRALLSLAAHYDLELHQMDVVTAFLNGDLDVDIYMEQPEGFIVPGKEHMVCKLRKSLYGLKQAGRAWYQKIHQALLNLGFVSLQTDTCVYILREDSIVLVVALYVDDLLLLSNSLERLNAFKRDLSNNFRMKDLGEAHHILGIQIDRDRAAGTLSISQREYLTKLLQRTGMLGCRPAPTPLDTGAILSKDDCPTTDTADAAFIRRYQSAVGAIMYAMLGTRPDIAFAIMALSQFCSNPGLPHWTAVNHLLHYLAGTVDYQLTYASDRQQPLSLFGFCDSDWASNQDDRRSVTGYVFMLGGGAVSWQAKKQTTVALSSVEAEYMAASQATKEALWWRMLLRELGTSATSATSLLSDSQGSIALSKNPEHHARSKHIAIRHHFVREQVAAGTIELRYISTDDMAADVLTKPLTHVKHRRLLPMLGLHSALSAVGVLE
jgi:Reverse transcriptase (RNA-dependent DNA polymerase)